MQGLENSERVIRIATEADMLRLLEIYAYYVEETSITFEWGVPSLEEFTGRYQTIIQKYPYLVMEEGGVIVGYAYANTFKGRKAYDWGVETTIYLEKDSRGGGRGVVLYEELENYLKQQNIVNLNSCVTNPDSESVRFHKKMGYEMVAHFHKCGYKFKQWHDMVWLEKIIGEHKNDMPDVIWFQELIKREG